MGTCVVFPGVEPTQLLLNIVDERPSKFLLKGKAMHFNWGNAWDGGGIVQSTVSVHVCVCTCIILICYNCLQFHNLMLC